ncbi:MAG: DUF2294 domain-containing protein [Oscillatoriales cyanobacterium RM1_1_9]|nr:DUF2294 domain-containing protein [Oscillatoriales cyanobacterium SM2_3_0]NJO45574.1 DUF2294 domain-containing protein [Oscillatoriales cyanobacterium RM2_1_1]NJO71297.1 DUF2294 domain-containing protein [Oscillatoriales cyanobacterium RM1_1_9]
MVVQSPTRGQLERTLSQKIQAFYREQLGHQPSKVTCQLFDSKLAIILEESVTPAENLLIQEGKEDLAEKVRSNLDELLRPQLRELVTEILKVEVTDLLSDATLETGRTGIIAVLANSPAVRSSDHSTIARQRKRLDQQESD